MTTIAIPPNLDKGVVFRVLKPVEQFTSEDSPDPFDLTEGGVFFMRYRAVRNLFRTGHIELV
jgi:hypothetical protein